MQKINININHKHDVNLITTVSIDFCWMRDFDSGMKSKLNNYNYGTDDKYQVHDHQESGYWELEIMII